MCKPQKLWVRRYKLNEESRATYILLHLQYVTHTRTQKKLVNEAETV